MEIILTEEIKAYIDHLSDPSELAQIYRYLRRQEELGYRIKEPVSKPLGRGIYELRPGPHRLLFFHQGQRTIFIHAFRKRSRKIRRVELDAAIRKKDRYLSEQR